MLVSTNTVQYITGNKMTVITTIVMMMMMMMISDTKLQGCRR